MDSSPTSPTEYALYLRKSVMDLDDPDALARHERTLRRLVKKAGGVVREKFCDPDKSASKETVIRPEFERLLVELPTFGGLVAMDLDRVTRNSPKLESVIAVFDAHPHLQFLVDDEERSPDLGSPQGRNEARRLVIRANDEALQIARRMRSAHEDLREQAEPHIGVPGFGMATRTEIDERQAQLIREAARDALAGMNTNAIAKAWRDAGVTTPRGKAWSGMQVARMLRSPRMAGYRVHQGDRYRLDETGEWARCGPVFLDEATWEAVVTELDRRAVAKEPRRTRRSYLLSGWLMCGVCAGSMTGNVWPDGVRYSYNCNKGCMSIAGHRLDPYIEDLLLRRWATASALNVEPADGPDTAKRKRLESLNKALLARVRAEELSLDDVAETLTANRHDIDEIKAEERAHVRQRARREAASTNPVERWHALKAEGDLERRLLMVQQRIKRIVIQPAAPGSGRQWDEGRVAIAWA